MINHKAAQTMVMVTLTSIILSTGGYILSHYLLHFLGVETTVYDGALQFMRISFIGVVFVFIFAMFQSLVRGVGQTRIFLYIVSFTVFLILFLIHFLFLAGGPFLHKALEELQ